MEFEVKTSGLLADAAKNRKKKHETPSCPACGEPLEQGSTQCEICGGSRLSDAELSAKLSELARKRNIMVGIAIALVVVTVVFALALRGIINSPWIILIVIPFLLAFWPFSKATKYGGKIKAMVSTNLVRDLLAEVFDLQEYSYRSGVGEQLVSRTGLIGGWNEYSGNDLVRGTYKGIPFTYSDVHLERVTTTTGSDGDTHTKRETIFRGQWMVCDIKKNLASSLAVRERPRYAKERDQRKVDKRLASSVETENIAFNEQFQIVTADPHTAFYILTPHFMEHIVSADQAADGKTFLYFEGQQAHVAVHNGRNSLELHSTKEAADVPALRARFRAELKYITGIVDELLKNDYLFHEEEN